MLIRIILYPILALLLTISIELIVAYLFHFRSKNQLKIVALASVITNPVLSILISVTGLFTSSDSLIYFILALEVVVVYVEYRILLYVFGKDFTKRKLFILSLSMNAASYLFGLLIFTPLIRHFFNW